MQGQIGPRVTAIVPAIDFRLVRAEGGGDGFFGGGKIGPGGGGGDITLAVETFAELVVGAADVLVERVAAALFVAAEVVAIARRGVTVGTARLCIPRRGSHRGRFGTCGAIVGRRGLTCDQSERQKKECSEGETQAAQRTAEQEL